MPGLLREVVAQNVRALLAHAYPEAGNITRRMDAAEKELGLKWSTLQRVTSAGGGANLETLEQIATAFGLQAYQLLLPELDPKNPQIVKGALQAEQRLWKKIERHRATLPSKTEA